MTEAEKKREEEFLRLEKEWRDKHVKPGDPVITGMPPREKGVG